MYIFYYHFNDLASVNQFQLRFVEIMMSVNVQENAI